jgi:hypothetical protein
MKYAQAVAGQEFPAHRGSDEPGYRLLLRPLEARDREIVVDYPIEVSPRALGRPWYYVPLLLGIGVLLVVLALLLLLGS